MEKFNMHKPGCCGHDVLSMCCHPDFGLTAHRISDSEQSTITDSNPKDLIGAKKVRLDLVPPSSIIAQATAMEEGADKYGPYNWRSKKVKMSIYIAAILRHTLALLDGEDADPDSVSGKTHLAGILASAGIIVDAGVTGNLLDDRPPKGAASELLRDLIKR